MSGSAMRKIRTLSQKASRSPGNDSEKASGLKNVSWTADHPGVRTTTRVTMVAVTIRLTMPMAASRQDLRLR